MPPPGYVVEYASDHPHASKSGHMFQHRLVMECVLGRLLEPGEIVHHLDECKWNNHPDNLALRTHASHAQEHLDHRATRALPLTEQQVREALRGRTTKEAAAYLGCSVPVLYDRFSHLLTKRRSPGAGLTPEEYAALAPLAADPDVSLRQAAEILGHSPDWIVKMRRRAGLDWAYRPGRKVGATDRQPRARRGTGSRRQQRQTAGSSAPKA